MTLEHTLRVTSIRSQDPRGFGGCIFAGTIIDDQGQVQDATSYYVVKATARTLGYARVEPGQWWKVRGEASKRFLEVNGYRIVEWQLDAAGALLLRPSGEHIVAFMAINPAFVGVGRVKARKLWEAFGDDLYSLLDAGDTTALTAVLTPDCAAQVVAAWMQHGDSRTLQWLQAQGFDVAVGRKLLEFFGSETAAKLEEDPYRLLSFCASWRQVDGLARAHFGVESDDPRRLQGAIEEACYRIFKAGHTVALSSKLMSHLEGVLGTQTTTLQWRSLIPTALSQGLTNGSFVIGLHGVQPLGALVMERQVAQAIADRVLSTDAVELMPSDEIDELLLQFEKVEAIPLNSQQRDAIHLAANRHVVLITGGAGVGKTTVLKALYGIFDRAGIRVTQLALAGRAAMRMQEATDRPATTIANSLRNGKEGGFDERSVVVVDEASMVDIITVTDRRNGATDVRRIGASNRWVNGRPEGVTPGWILKAFGLPV